MKNYSFIYSFTSSSVALATEDYALVSNKRKSWYSRVPLIPFINIYVDVNMS